MRAWLLGLAAGEFDGPPPVARELSEPRRWLGAPPRSPTQTRLETDAHATYSPYMVDPPPEAPVPPGWHESLARSKAQIAAGESVPLLPVLDRLRASAERLEAERGVTADGEEVTAGG